MYYYKDMVTIDKLVGTTITNLSGLEEDSYEVVFKTDAGVFTFYHDQDCCETVLLNDFEVDFDLTGALILSAEEVVSEAEDCYESGTWTFYKIETNKGGLWMRWLGESNGYYSESVSINFKEKK